MGRLEHKYKNQLARKNRVRAVVSGTGKRPRLSVSFSNKNINVQLINDEDKKTLAAVSTVGAKSAGTGWSEMAAWAGAEIGKKAKKAKIKRVIFDRGGRLYHGQVKALADAARKSGLEF